MKPGDKVITPQRKVETVTRVEDVRIFTRENVNGWYHPTKLIPCYWSASLKHYVTVPGSEQ